MTLEPHGFIFDLDGVITDTAEYHYLAWKTLAEELDIPFSREFNEQLKGISRAESLEKILKHGKKEGDYSQEEKEKLMAKKNDHYKTLIQQITKEDVLPGIHDLIEEIKKHNMKLGLASASKNAFTVMEALELKSTFDVIVDAKRIKNGKPDPEIFLIAANLLGVEPENCIGIEDAKAGIEAIKGAGMYAIAIGPKNEFEQADLVYENTGDLNFQKIIEEFLKRS